METGARKGTATGPAPGSPDADSADGFGGDGTVSSGTKVANQDQQARSATRPQRPAPPGPLKPTRARRRPALIALGLALVALSVLAAVYLVSTLGQTYEALAVTNDVSRGSVITPSDLGVVELPITPSSLEPVRADQMDEYVGKVATADLKKGQLLTRSGTADELEPPAGQSVVGIALTPSQMPLQALRAGDSVRIVETPAAGGEPPAQAPFTIAATVVSPPTDTAVGDQKVVDVRVASSNAAALAARAATGRVALVLDSTGQG
ncbi:Flagella basal body P-ring formation protein FlgA [Promicromonospora thailandica]|uniref:Flagella basal body P-ring formation protein FlgA n=1 Tax=Promicromonospora thailandica TaxID=765201 RepID=A0A9X2G3T0_9MICO|nr:Flagella basal body P-ring formation protein FlgA [Promicromonospora thailandica]